MSDKPHKDPHEPVDGERPPTLGADGVRPGLGMSRVAVVYGVMALLGWLGAGWLLDHNPLFLPDGPEPGLALWLVALLGAGTGAVVAVLDLVLERIFPSLKKMTEAFHELLGAMTPGRALAFAALSAVGEEILFRGLLMPWLGLVASSLIFGALHFPPDRRLWLWPILAVLMGFLFGWLFMYTGSLLAPVLAHFTVNYFGFMRLYEQTRPRVAGPPDHSP